MKKIVTYPFGMAFAEGTTTEQGEQSYKYNGKELDRNHELNCYDYSARQLDNAYGRFTTQDPHSENYYSWSPYVYVGNNPMRIIDPNGKDWVYRVVDGVAEVYYDRSVRSQDDVNVKYGSDGGVTHLTTGSALTRYEKGSIVAQYTFTNDTKENKYGTMTDMNGNTVDNSKITSGNGYSIFGTSDNSVNAETLHNNYFGSSYIGDRNPQDYLGNDSYQYYPRGKADQAAYQHDLDYDANKTKGLSGALGDYSAQSADRDLVARCWAISQNPSSNLKDRAQANYILAAFGPISAYKYLPYKGASAGAKAYMDNHYRPAMPYIP